MSLFYALNALRKLLDTIWSTGAVYQVYDVAVAHFASSFTTENHNSDAKKGIKLRRMMSMDESTLSFAINLQ